MDETQKTMFYPSGRIKQVEGWMKPNPVLYVLNELDLELNQNKSQMMRIPKPITDTGQL